MKRLFCLFWILWVPLTLLGQSRTYEDNASGAFVIGLENYFYGESGSLSFQAGDESVLVSLAPDGSIRLGDEPFAEGRGEGWECIVGAHDFTNDGVPELVIGWRSNEVLEIQVFQLKDGEWVQQEGDIVVPGGREARIFRQLVSIRCENVLHSWTWHYGKFDYKSSGRGSI